jgi:hypothetical protein
MQLNGWQRLGIVLSALWMLFIAIIALFEYGGWLRLGEFTFIYEVSTLETGARFVHDLGLLYEPSFKVSYFATALLLPVLIGWITVYLLAWGIRWVHRGFKRK